MSLAILFHLLCALLNMFRTLIYSSSGACDYSVELPFWSYLFLARCLLEFRCGWVGVVSSSFSLQHGYTPTQPHRNSNTHRTKNITTNVQISNFTKIRPLSTELFQADRRTGRQIDRLDEALDEVNNRFSQFCLRL